MVIKIQQRNGDESSEGEHGEERSTYKRHARQRREEGQEVLPLLVSRNSPSSRHGGAARG